MKKQFFVIFSALIIISMLTPNITSAQGWNIEMVGSLYNYWGEARGVAVAGNFAYVADGFAGLRLVNIADPSAPYETGYYDPPGLAEGVAVAGNFAYVADGFVGLRIVNIADPSAPFETGYYYTPGYARGVAVAGNFAYVADAYHFEIFDCSDALGVEKGIQPETPTSFRLLNPYPNPFNAEMTVEFELPRASEVVLSLYDVSGRLAGCLEKNNFTSGTHIVHYNAENLASGIYFLQMKSVGFEQTKKITLLK